MKVKRRMAAVATVVSAIAALAAQPASAHFPQPQKNMTPRQQVTYGRMLVRHARSEIVAARHLIRELRHQTLAATSLHHGWRALSTDPTIAATRRTQLVRIKNHRFVLRYGQRQIQIGRSRMNPWAVPAYFMGQAICVHHGEGGWNANTGNGFGGGLQFMVGTWNHAATLSHGKLPHVSSTGQIAAMPPAAQIYAAYLIVVVERSGWGQWPNTARRCGLL